MDRLGFLELSHIVMSLGAGSKDVREFRHTLHAFHDFVAGTHHPDMAAVVMETGAALIRAALRSAVATVARGLSAKLRPGMRLRVRREGETAYSFFVTFPDYTKLVEGDQDVYHRRAFLEVFDLMSGLGEAPPLIEARLWDGDLDGTLRSAACPRGDAEGSLHFPGNGATYRTSIQAWRQGVPAYLDGVSRVQVWVDMGAAVLGWADAGRARPAREA